MFKAGDRVVRVGESYREVRKGEQYTVAKYIPMIGLLLEGLGDFGYSYDSFKLVEENMNKQFTKDMLVAGKHVVEYRSGERRLILEAQGVVGCAGQDGYREDLSSYNDCLINTYDRNTYDNGTTIMKVYTLSNVYHFTELLKDSNLTLIWQREEKSEAQIKLEQLEEQQRKLADEIAAVRKSL